MTEDLFLHRLWVAGNKETIAESAFWLNQFFEGVKTQADVDRRIAFGETLLKVKELRSTSTLSAQSDTEGGFQEFCQSIEHSRLLQLKSSCYIRRKLRKLIRSQLQNL
ncbi:MAG: hypothetical protein MUC48_11675 [Leptolyngbya sp. Prado105]|nr:hypothetical protein [Leptolyngbya sp. Prado105]